MEPKKLRKAEEPVLVRAQAQAQARTVNHLFELPIELLGEVLGHYIRDARPWKTHPKTLAQVNLSIEALEGICKRSSILRLVIPTTARLNYGLKRQYVTAIMAHTLRKQKLLLERHHSTDLNCINGAAMRAIYEATLNCINGAAMRAIYEATWYQVTFVQTMVKDGMEDLSMWRFLLERLKKVEPHSFFAGFVGGEWQGLQQVV